MLLHHGGMKWLFLFLLPGFAFASGIYNPGSGGGGSLAPGSTNYIQNTLTPTISTQSFAVQVGSFSVAGWYIMDSANCLWQTQINPSGVLFTTLINCPTVVASRPCTTGMSLGLLAAITCP